MWNINRQSWSETAMSNAVAAVKAGQIGTLKAAKQFGVPRSTVQWLAKQSNGPVLVKKHLGSKTKVFPESTECELVYHIKALSVVVFTSKRWSCFYTFFTFLSSSVLSSISRNMEHGKSILYHICFFLLLF